MKVKSKRLTNPFFVASHFLCPVEVAAVPRSHKIGIKHEAFSELI